ncbi:nucleotidyltransferase domain-containing protein [Acidobacteria bacterium AH-259-D05]|nr:nucleotidyltransferase domain-containing protein [Acidobacteria bacterium AH-259-D05]
MNRIRGRLAALAEMLPLKRVVLFGSWAKRKATVFSDVDLLVVYADPSREDAYQIVWKCLDIRGLEPHVYSEKEAIERERSLKRMAEDGIVLFPPTAL